MRANAEVLEDIEGNANWLLHYVGGSTQSSDRMRRDIVEFEDALAGVIEGNTDWLLHVGKRRSRTRSRGWEGCGVGDAEWARAHTGAHEQSLIMIWLLSVGENPSTHTLFVLNGRVAYKFPVMKAVDRESRMNALDT